LLAAGECYSVGGVIRFLIRIAVYFAAAAIGLIVAAALFDGVQVDTFGFIIVAAIYAVVLGLLSPLFAQQAQRSRSSMFSGGVGLITTFMALAVTAFISDDLTIDGFGTWIGATVVVWLATLVAALLLPVLVVKRVVDERHR
jgi:uncharacterized membrane protein YvlD (DUF360 family)